MRKAFALVLATSCLAAEAFPQPEPKSPPVQTQRPVDRSSRPVTGQLRVSGQVYIGERAPDFELSDTRGRPLKLSRFRGNWVVLTFTERREALVALRSIRAEMLDLGADLVAVCADKPQALRTLVDRDSIDFQVLSDPTREISAIYGLFDSAHSEILPGFLVLDRDGIVRLALLGQALPPSQIADLARFTISGL
jgi:peroxiredoxin